MTYPFSGVDALLCLALGLSIWWAVAAEKRRVPFCETSREDRALSVTAVGIFAFGIFARWSF